ncbi:hypothetical protein EU538_09070 [Candidatus Thorarchaeota archaeon]|nr:MAG: hypothetical protein EU538_09070 [Candidatus Thorarchaeota archaeon]
MSQTGKKRDFTIADIVQRLTESGVNRENIDYFSDLIDREYFICEERFGNANRVTYELRELRDFLVERLAPRIEGALVDNPNQELMRFVEQTLSEETLRRRLTFAGRRLLRSYLSPDVQTQDATA